ncbi:uncharacterized protein HMPREF1541_10928 [Cyphellophora europaea CBS 101466]|uniref:HMA domain-containing protein n=1 Tax=Cyphellophora europaea (strain CBS 101466) TaxID=1220924 RepID=W2S7N8_CYPE1|nr:uncharacterized protein HMPREF1541_10928 [Cyphellophora europaea CBS 101466]ETN44063.1 hypothetical protein HMPREF1541_10928 [Cyphellophora europaea CBS 101466]
MIEAVGYGASVDRLQPHNAKKPEMHNAPTDAWHATYNLHGMTCSSCVGHITRAVQALDFINKVEISLLSHIASVIFLGRDNVSAISQAIEDAGYGAALDIDPHQRAALRAVPKAHRKCHQRAGMGDSRDRTFFK